LEGHGTVIIHCFQPDADRVSEVFIGPSLKRALASLADY
jgi:hypothetical protein